MIPHERLRTPDADGAVLVEPAVRDVLDCAPLPEWAMRLRRGLRARLGLGSPLVVTGHQCELFHAGVFAKTIAARRLSTRLGGEALFVHVDSDTPKSTILAIPTVADRRIRRVVYRLPALEPDVPIELQARPESGAWDDVFGSLASAETGVRDAVLDAYARGWKASGGELANHFAVGHRATEAALGVEPLHDWMMSALAETPEFGAFAARLVADAAGVAQAYNAAQAAYRRRHKVRNASRPVPLLETIGNSVESPLWVYRRDGDRMRHRLFVESTGGSIALFAGSKAIATIDACEAERIAEEGGRIDTAGWLVRPRALTLSAFCRLILADVFIHGIGGAKYDEVTENFVHAWLGAVLPPLLCVSATVRLTIAPPGESAGVWISPREVKYNPQRVLESAPILLVARRADLIAQSEALRRGRAGRRDRRRVFEAIRAVNDEIVAACRAEVDEIAALRRRHAERREERLIAADREVFYAMHSSAALARMAGSIAERING